MFRCLKTGLGGISPDECDILENYVIVWDIRGGMWLREGDWTASPDGYGREMTETAAARLRQVNGVRRRVRLLLEPLYQGMKTASSARSKAECLYTFLQEAGVPQALEETAGKLLAENQGASRTRRRPPSCGRSSAASWTSLWRSWGTRS